MKKRGFGQGKYNGFGGKPQGNETILQATVREMQEESNIKVSSSDLDKKAELTFIFSAKPEWNQVVHVFTAKQWENEPVESDEMKPQWFHHSEIPFQQMWNDDRHWLPLVLKGENLKATFVFAEDNETIKEFSIREL